MGREKQKAKEGRVLCLVTAFLSGRGVESACMGIARNPEAKGPITTTMILGLALIESIAIYGLVIAFILLYANPYKEALLG